MPAKRRTHFETMRKRERGGKVAGTDIITAQLQLQQRESKLLDAQTAALRARMAHVVLLLSNPTQTYAIIGSSHPTCPWPNSIFLSEPTAHTTRLPDTPDLIRN